MSQLLRKPLSEHFLSPALPPRHVVIVDNLGANEAEKVKALSEERGCQLLVLATYSTYFNPIQEAFSKIKGLLPKADTLTREAMGRAISAVASREAHGFSKHCVHHHRLNRCDQRLRGAAHGRLQGTRKTAHGSLHK
jgi:transposase